jgi:hypothetical protein
VLHLPRDFNLIDQSTQDRIQDFANRFGGRLYGMVVHDHRAMVSRAEEYLRAVRSVNQQLSKTTNAPLLFIEYAVGLETDQFLAFFSRISDLDRVSTCIDIGHVGIQAARNIYAARCNGEDLCSLKSQPPGVSERMPAVETALAGASSTVLELVTSISSLEKPVHFHLHDGHPLSTFSPFGVADHLSFFTEIPLKFEYRGRRTVPTMFGPEGLGKVVARALDSTVTHKLSFTLEIHPGDGSLPLGDADSLFSHWVDKTNAERMNQWLAVLVRNHGLLLDSIHAALEPSPR